MICYAVIDTNVLVSALLSNYADAATVQVIGRMIAGEIIPIYSEQIMREYQEVLGRKKFRFEPEMIRYILSSIEKYGVLIEPSATGKILPDMKDLPFYEVVMEKREENAYLVTGNLKHFPSEPFIVTARQMLDILDGKKIEIEN
ncbi:MAG: putative toxin-antitoxin system toxin component, PIN family [bacterium]|nr:putative toxin-antitoxin system toxin component, PIN family [bacterium]MDY4098935.1 putative toxin-antitoxin system toxin component, PIN family [Lachnospiraceae bacterium]